MTIDIKRNKKEVTIVVAGRLDTNTAPALDKVVNEDASDAEGIIMDMSELEYISSAGLRVLLTAHKKMLKAGFLRLINVQEGVMEVLKMTGFARIMDIE